MQGKLWFPLALLLSLYSTQKYSHTNSQSLTDVKIFLRELNILQTCYLMEGAVHPDHAPECDSIRFRHSNSKEKIHFCASWVMTQRSRTNIFTLQMWSTTLSKLPNMHRILSLDKILPAFLFFQSKPSPPQPSVPEIALPLGPAMVADSNPLCK